MGEFDALTKYIPLIEDDEMGVWIIDEKNNGTPEHPIQMPFVHYSRTVHEFIVDVYDFIDQRKDLRLDQYRDIFEENNVGMGSRNIIDTDVSLMKGQFVAALIVASIRADRISEGTLLRLFKDGYITKWLKRLKEIDHS
ncbi:DUF6508 domain-containing protein [Jeotgalibaca caeni]|uniref:DUF6508 domain-containing protein n=1 Tax=Jeotgalibaca caeni TaxID=3028623 RepID=UPI00237E3438|nr:DUF6508 domain-containing protein [Jeotgalibaca caeni]MDE1549837.1 DUF6508 domain-containing protein [Jeotgalibaca caeni]